MESLDNRLMEIRNIMEDMATDVTCIEEKTATLRDQFAMAAMTSMLSRPQDLAEGTPKIAADWAYKFADAMMKARENEPS